MHATTCHFERIEGTKDTAIGALCQRRVCARDFRFFVAGLLRMTWDGTYRYERGPALVAQV